MTSTDTSALRSARRFKVFQPIELIRGGAAHRAHILDLSLTGARVHAEQPPEPDTIVTMRIFDRAHRARVTWRRGRRIGLAFLLPLSRAEIGAIVGDAGFSPAP